MRHSRRIDIQSNPENCAVWRKVGGVLEHIFEGKFIVPSKLHAVGEPRGGLGDLVPPKRFARRSTDNDGNGRCEGQYAQDIFKKTESLLDAATTVSYSVNLSKSTRRRSTAVKSIGVVAKRSLRCACTKLAAGAPMATIRSGGWSTLRVRRYSTNGASDLSLFRRAFNSEWS